MSGMWKRSNGEGSAGATLVVMTDDLDHGHRATSRLYRELPIATVTRAPQNGRPM